MHLRDVRGQESLLPMRIAGGLTDGSIRLDGGL